MMLPPPTNNVVPNPIDWVERADRAIASRLVYTHALLQAERTRLERLKASVYREALLTDADREAPHQLATRIANYYRAQGRFNRCLERLGAEIDRAVMTYIDRLRDCRRSRRTARSVRALLHEGRRRFSVH